MYLSTTIPKHFARLLAMGYDLRQPNTWLNPPNPVVVPSPYDPNSWSKALVRFNDRDGGAIFHCPDGPVSYHAKHRTYGGWELYGVPHRIGGYAGDGEYWVCGVKLTDEEYFAFQRLYSKDKERALAMVIKEALEGKE